MGRQRRIVEDMIPADIAKRAARGLLLAACCIAATLSAPVRTMDELGFVLLAVPGVVAGWASVTPVPALMVTSLSVVAFYALGYNSIFAPGPITVVVLVAALQGRRIHAAIASAVACLGTYAAGLGNGLTPGEAAIGPLWIAAWLLAAGAVGDALRKRRQLLAHERRRSETAAQQGADQERLRIARELHDSLTHSISVVTVQASVAAHLFDRQPERVPLALEAIRAASAEALHELRRTVEVLHRHEAAGLARLPHLVEQSRAMGLRIDTAVDTAGPLPAEVDRAAYRIIQEALANVARHAPGAQVEVAIGDTSGALDIAVRNGPARCPVDAPPGVGVGLTGMRERVRSLNGELRAGPTGTGFLVHAILPLEQL